MHFNNGVGIEVSYAATIRRCSASCGGTSGAAKYLAFLEKG